MMDERGNMNYSDPQLEFFNFDALSDDEVQRIKNLLKQPCSAVELPDITIYSTGKDQVNGVASDHKSVAPVTLTINYNHPVVTTYAQPHMYMTSNVASTVNYITHYAVPNLYMASPARKPYVNGIDCGDNDSGNAASPSGAGSIAEQIVDPNVAGMVVPSNVYQPAWTYPCPAYVLPSVPTFFTPIASVHASGIRAPTSTVTMCGENAIPSTVTQSIAGTAYVAVAPVPIPPSAVADPSIMSATQIPVPPEQQRYNTDDGYYENSEDSYDAKAESYPRHGRPSISSSTTSGELEEEEKPSESEKEKPNDIDENTEANVEISKPAPSVNKTWASLFKGKAPSASTYPQQLQKHNATTANHQPKFFQSPEETISTVVEKDKNGALTVNGNGSSSISSTQQKTSKVEAPGGSVFSEHLQTNGFPKEINISNRSLGELLIGMKVDQKYANFYPRGLQNKGNWCYINATLQALLACPPFHYLLSKLPNVVGLQNGKSNSPITDCMVEFINEFSPKTNFGVVTIASRKKEDLPVVTVGTHFEPSYIYSVMSKLKSDAFEGRQEDAEEFLTCLLNGLHEEMLAAISSVEVSDKKGNGQPTENNDEDEESWKVIEKGNKSSVTRSTTFSPSPVSEIFCGRIRSALHAVSVSSATLQPFFSLQLDIQSDNVRSVKEALLGLVTKETLQGYHCSKTKQEVAASRQITLEELPPILILHLKRFIYDKDGGCQKLSKRLEFKINLEFGKELLSSTAKSKLGSSKQKNYRLIAVVYHCGREAVKGHYIADVYHQSSTAWIRADDTRLTVVPESEVLNHPNNMVPYLLFYRRLDEPLTNSVGSIK